MYIRRIPGNLSGKRMSDHRVLKIVFKVDINKRGNGYWKMNNSHLSDLRYKQGIKSIIEELNDNFDINPLDKWGMFKTKAREYSISFSKTVRKTLNQKINHIEKRITEIENEDSQNINMNNKRELEAELDELYNEKFKGA